MNYFKQLKMAVLDPGHGAGGALDRNNRIAVFAFAILPGLSPNFNSFILLASMVWGLYGLVTGRLALNLSRSDRLVAISMSIYPLVMIASIFINPPYSEELDWILRLLESSNGRIALHVLRWEMGRFQSQTGCRPDVTRLALILSRPWAGPFRLRMYFNQNKDPLRLAM